jgi:dihydroorotate dehydrogenase (fumarate)
MLATNFFDKTYTHIFKPLVFKIDAEYAHDLFTNIWCFLGRRSIGKYIVYKLFRFDAVYLEQDIAGIHFTNPIWLSAWFDKDVLLPDIMDSVWFWYLQVGSITHLPYSWNQQPRLRRLPEDKWLIVNYWLKNNWVTYAIHQLKKITTWIPISVSVAKTNCKKTVTIQEWIDDYVASLSLLEKNNVVDIYTINISCPNTFWWEPFTTPELLDRLLQDIEKLHLSKPILIKMPVDLSREVFKALLDVIITYKVEWVIVSNLVKNRDTLIDKHEDMPWWISGKPTQKLADTLIYNTYKEYHKKLIIIGVGWIFSAEDAYHKIKSWASLVQLITWMIFQWPQLIGKINKGLVKLAKKDGYDHISQAIWAYHR